MNQKVKYALGVVIFIVVIVGLNFAYQALRNTTKDQIENTVTKQQTQANDAYNFTLFQKEKQVALEEFKGKPIVLNFWTSWCGYCKVEMPEFQQLYEEEKDNIHILMVNVATDDIKQDAEQYIAENAFTFPVYYDEKGEGVRKYRVTGYPITILINQDFQIVKQYNGRINMDTLKQDLSKIQ